ncbi:PQQ-like beta-propeller repeat protein [Sphingomonas sanxanigenens]|uniref:Pyrrolo-quinoline quinone repeat domain-containing protein n=1 Tax=Sphingomonas sanxanigenens DSM 19645 = NX02 TaxID=1123269 RepID=W0AGE7_9SPHN|nr:PQQ-like beta-propeller repeat protein [Sphingomonas sanxanigenens]AHE56969.1 hypothetical protein NX02_26900 [Sphingomonas sanxanigenens DSM 19645 = NX02]
MKIDLRIPAAALALLALSGCGVFGIGGKGNKPKTPVLGDRVAVLTSESSVELDPGLSDVAILLPPPEANSGWTQPGGNAAKAPGHLALGSGTSRVWTASVAGGGNRARLAAAPVVANGKLYVVDIDAKLTAFNAETGARLWSVPIGDTKKNAPSRFGGGVSVEGERVYATNGVGDVGAYNAADGSQIWVKRPAGPLRGAPTVANGSIYVMSQDSQLFAMTEADGTVQWQEAGALEVAGVFGVAAPAVAQGTVVSGYSSGELRAYRYENGRPLWDDALSRTSISTSVSSLSDIDADPVIDQGRVYAVGQGGRMVSMDLVTGQRIWEINIAGISTPWVAGEWVYVVTDDAKLLCLARANGKVRWMAQLRRWRDEKDRKGPINWTGPVLAGGKLIVVNTRGEMIHVSPADGTVQQTVDVGKPMHLSPVVANNMLYLLDDEGRITAWR